MIKFRNTGSDELFLNKFDIYDDFEDGIVDTNKWTTVIGAGATITETNGSIRMYSPIGAIITSITNKNNLKNNTIEAFGNWYNAQSASGSGQAYFRIILTDGATNNITLLNGVSDDWSTSSQTSGGGFCIRMQTTDILASGFISVCGNSYDTPFDILGITINQDVTSWTNVYIKFEIKSANITYTAYGYIDTFLYNVTQYL